MCVWFVIGGCNPSGLENCLDIVSRFMDFCQFLVCVCVRTLLHHSKNTIFFYCFNPYVQQNLDVKLVFFLIFWLICVILINIQWLILISKERESEKKNNHKKKIWTFNNFFFNFSNDQWPFFRACRVEYCGHSLIEQGRHLSICVCVCVVCNDTFRWQFLLFTVHFNQTRKKN